MDLKETEILGADIASHWYYASKARALTRFLDGTEAGTILDVGAGSGFFSRHLLQQTPADTSWCVDINYDDDSDAEENGKRIHYRRSITSLEADLVLMMDVLEHIEDDTGFLREYLGKVPAGSRFLFTVPAFNFLWSDHDKYLGHQRRYSLAQLERVVEEAGLEVTKTCYYFASVFPIAAALRLGQRLRKNHAEQGSQLTRHTPLTNAILASLCRAELPLMHLNRLAGLSLFCLAEKP